MSYLSCLMFFVGVVLVAAGNPPIGAALPDLESRFTSLQMPPLISFSEIPNRHKHARASVYQSDLGWRVRVRVYDDAAQTIQHTELTRFSPGGRDPDGLNGLPSAGQECWSTWQDGTTDFEVGLRDGRAIIQVQVSTRSPGSRSSRRRMGREELETAVGLLRETLDRLVYMGYTSRDPSTASAKAKQEVDNYGKGG